jgi:biotin carboxyl carrier protein
MTEGTTSVARIADGMYVVEHDGRREIVYVAGPAADRWVFWNGQTFRGDFRADRPQPAPGAGRQGVQPTALTALTAPMPARVGKIPAASGSRVRKGDTVIVLEAMKMELPIRAPADAIVRAVHCREGDLVQAGVVLMDLE